MMSGNGANPIFFNNNKKRLDVQNSLPPTPLRPITPNFHLTPTLSLKVNVLCVSPLIFNPFHATGLLSIPLEIPENERSSDVFWGYNSSVTRNRLMYINSSNKLFVSSEVYLELCQTVKIERFAKIVNGWKLLIVFCENHRLRCLTGFWIRFWN